MNTIVNLIIIVILSLGSGYAVKKLLFSVEEVAIKKVDLGLSKTEPFARTLTGDELNF